MSAILKTLSDAEIKEFLETAALYSWREYKKPNVVLGRLAIREIDAFCEVCDQPRPFQDLRSSGGGAGIRYGSGMAALTSGTSYFEFTCVSCTKAMRRIWVEQVVGDDTIKLQKVGEMPRRSLLRDRVLQKFFADDLEYYEKAVVCLTYEYGIAAFAYFRRIVEKNIARLLDLVQEDATASGADPATTEALAELRKDSPMKDKIDVANLALPIHLKPDGLNPLGKLYQVLSEGVHSLSDAECLERAKAIRECLTYLLSELATRKEHRARFKSSVGQL